MLLKTPECGASFVESTHVQRSGEVDIGVVDASGAKNPTVFLVNSDICPQKTAHSATQGNVQVSWSRVHLNLPNPRKVASTPSLNDIHVLVVGVGRDTYHAERSIRSPLSAPFRPLVCISAVVDGGFW